MKFCFHMQRRFAKVAHALALILKENHGINQFCGLVATRESLKFLNEQKDINYTNLILDEDIHNQYKDEDLDLNYLRNLEKQYGIPNLWPFLMIDRVLMKGQLIREYPYDKPQYSYVDMMKILQVTAKNIINFLEKERPDAIFFSAIGNVSSYMLYEIGKKFGSKTLIGELGRFPSQYMVFQNYKDSPETRDRFDKILNEETNPDPKLIRRAEEIIENFLKNPRPYAESDSISKQKFATKKRTNPAKSAYWFLSTLKSYYRNPTSHDYTDVNPWLYLIDKCKRKIRNAIGFKDLYDHIDEGESFAYFPLNYEPEISLLLYAPFNTDQLHTIKQVAISLPIEFKLYVKEHPTMVGYRTKDFYKKLKEIPNVKLINPAVTSFELIKNCKLVVTITGTGGWEAILFRKPSITFGHNFYNMLSMVKNCKSMEDLPYMIKHQLENFRYNHKELIAFLSLILENTANMDMARLWHETADSNELKSGVIPLADLIIKKINT